MKYEEQLQQNNKQKISLARNRLLNWNSNKLVNIFLRKSDVHVIGVFHPI